MTNIRSQLPPNIRLAVSVALALIVVGMALWLVNTYIPMAGSIKTILNIFVVMATCVGVLRAVGIWEDIVHMWDRLRGSRLPR